MSSMIALHRLAAPRGEGLHPKLLALFDERARRAADPRVAELDVVRNDNFKQAGPCPRPPLPDFLPENVVRFDTVTAAAACGRKWSPAS